MTRTRFSRLLEPGRIGTIELRNRTIMAPMVTRYVADDGTVSERLINYYVERARGGVGLIVIEACYPSSRYPGRICVSDDSCLPGLKRLAEAVHGAGSKIAIQLNPSRGRYDEIESVSASGVGELDSGVKPRAITKEEISALVRDFGEATARACEAGVDAVMVHGASGYLVCDFLSPLTNRRTDEYGGDLRNRARFAVELVAAAKQKAGGDYPVIFRIMADEHCDGGFSPGEAATVCQVLEQAGVDAIDVVSGAVQTLEWTLPPAAMPRGLNRKLAQRIRSSVTVPVSVAGRIDNPALAEEILGQGEADFISLGRPLIADPHFVRKVQEGRANEIGRCVACLNCIEDVLHRKVPMTCTVNPAVGVEKDLAIKPAREVKRVLVVGGGPAGLEAARVAAERGHQVEVWEKSSRVGGQLNLAVVPPYKEALAYVLDYELSHLERLRVPVILNREATAHSVSEWKPDSVIVATGARPLIPEIPGIDTAMESAMVVTAWDVLSGRAQVGHEVVVLGGNMIGCETAEMLADRGRDVTIVRRGQQMAEDLPEVVRKLLLRRLAEKRVRMMPGVQYRSIREGFLDITDPQGKAISLPADTIALATGATPDNRLSGELRAGGLSVRAVGDCLEPRKLREALTEGAVAAHDI